MYQPRSSMFDYFYLFFIVLTQYIGSQDLEFIAAKYYKFRFEHLLWLLTETKVEQDFFQLNFSPVVQPERDLAENSVI
jgi:hypothetical protein